MENEPEDVFTMIELTEVRPEDRDLLWNLLQKYLYEMTAYYGNELDAAGNYRYRYFDAYFSEPGRKALLIYHDRQLAGFAMINPYAYISTQPACVLAEFTVFPAFRKKHIASEAAEAIFRRYGGRWEIKYHEQNIAAKLLWNKIGKRYNAVQHPLSDTETVLCFYTG